MILTQNKQSVVEKDGAAESSVNMSIDSGSIHLLMNFLSKNIYSDNIGSSVRETVSNAWDAAKKSGKDVPILVNLSKINGNWQFSVEDEALGLDDWDVENVISKYLASTKRNDNTQLGAIGVGFKSPLSYQNSFTFIGRKNGMERTWMMYEDEYDNKIDKLFEQPTDKPNGVKIIIAIKGWDQSEFSSKIREQLCYFSNIFVTDDYNRFNNDFKIYENDIFKWSEVAGDNKLHMCLGEVYYPIDFKRLGIPDINIPVAIKLKLTDGVTPTINRENLMFSPETKALILGKIKALADWMVEKYNENNLEKDSILDIWKDINSNNKYVQINDAEGNLLRSIEITPLLKYTAIKPVEPSVKGITHLHLPRIILMQEDLMKKWRYCGMIKSTMGGNRWQADYKHGWSSEARSILDKVLHKTDTIYKLKNKLSNVTKDYIKELGVCYFITESSFVPTLQNYIRILELKKVKKEEWRAHISEYQKIQEQLAVSFKDGDAIIPTAQWLQERKDRIVRTKATKTDRTEIHPKIAETSTRGDLFAVFKADTNRMIVNELDKQKHLYIYGNEEEKYRLSETFRLVKNAKVCYLGKKDYQKMEEIKIHNWVKIEDFMQGRYKEFSRVCSAFKIQELLSKQQLVLGNLDYISKLNKDFSDDVKKLLEYKKGYVQFSTPLLADMLAICEEKKLWDLEILSILHRVEKWMGMFDFLGMLKFDESRRYSSTIDDKTLPLAMEIMRARKMRMNLSNYHLIEISNDGVPTEDVVENLAEEIELEETVDITI